MLMPPIYGKFLDLYKVLFALVPLLLINIAANAQHNHSNASLNISIVDTEFAVDVVLPAEAVLGFEREPETDGERAKLRDARQRLLNSSDWLIPSSKAQCSPVSEGANLMVSGEHGELIVNIHMRCAQIAKLQGLEVKLLQMDFHLETLDVLVLTEAGNAVMSRLGGAETLVDLSALGPSR